MKSCNVHVTVGSLGADDEDDEDEELLEDELLLLGLLEFEEDEPEELGLLDELDELDDEPFELGLLLVLLFGLLDDELPDVDVLLLGLLVLEEDELLLLGLLELEEDVLLFVGLLMFADVPGLLDEVCAEVLSDLLSSTFEEFVSVSDEDSCSNELSELSPADELFSKAKTLLLDKPDDEDIPLEDNSPLSVALFCALQAQAVIAIVAAKRTSTMMCFFLSILSLFTFNSPFYM